MTWGVAHGCRHGLWNNTTKIGLGDERLDALQGYGIYGHVEPFALKQRPHFQPHAFNVVNVRETDYNNGLTIWVGEGI